MRADRNHVSLLGCVVGSLESGSGDFREGLEKLASEVEDMAVPPLKPDLCATSTAQLLF